MSLHLDVAVDVVIMILADIFVTVGAAVVVVVATAADDDGGVGLCTIAKILMGPSRHQYGSHT